MLENPTAPIASDSAPVVKRYAPPNQRNRSLNRRKSADRFDRTSNLYGNDAEKYPANASRNVPNVDHGDIGSNILMNEKSRAALIALEGCCSSEASKLLNDRWAAAMQCLNDMSIDVSERPVMYSGAGESAWGNIRLPHQLMASPGSGGPPISQMDFLGELRHARYLTHNILHQRENEY